MEIHTSINIPAQLLVVLDHIDLQQRIIVHGLGEQRIGVKAQTRIELLERDKLAVLQGAYLVVDLFYFLLNVLLDVCQITDLKIRELLFKGFLLGFF